MAGTVVKLGGWCFKGLWRWRHIEGSNVYVLVRMAARPAPTTPKAA